MKQVIEKGIAYVAWQVVPLCITVLVAVGSQPAVGQVNRGNPLIKQGEFPPDFNLPRLRFRTDEKGKTVGVIDMADTVRLSSFRGKRPVCLIMSSYT